MELEFSGGRRPKSFAMHDKFISSVHSIVSKGIQNDRVLIFSQRFSNLRARGRSCFAFEVKLFQLTFDCDLGKSSFKKKRAD